MGQILHGSVSTTAAIRRAIQNSEESLRVLAKRHGINPKTDRAFDPRLWAAPDGKLWVMYAQSGNKQTYDGQYGVWVSVIADPLAVQPSFEPEFWLADGVLERPFRFKGA